MDLVNMKQESYLLDVKDKLIESKVNNALRIGWYAATKFSC
jgi:hypothetical protein